MPLLLLLFPLLVGALVLGCLSLSFLPSSLPVRLRELPLLLFCPALKFCSFTWSCVEPPWPTVTCCSLLPAQPSPSAGSGGVCRAVGSAGGCGAVLALTTGGPSENGDFGSVMSGSPANGLMIGL